MSAPTHEDPAELIAQTDRLRRQTRAQARTAWLPLSTFALITLATVTLYRYPFGQQLQPGVPMEAPLLPPGEQPPPPIDVRPVPSADEAIQWFAADGPHYAGLPGMEWSLSLSWLFWVLLAPGAWFGAAWLAQRRGQRLGVQARWRPWLVGGVAAFAATFAGLALPSTVMVEVFNRSGADTTFAIWQYALTSPLTGVAVGLLVVGIVERSAIAAVAASTVGVTAVVFSVDLSALNDDGSIDAPGPRVFVLAGILLVAAAAEWFWAHRTAAAQ
jgi:hypothetical protein